MALATVLLAGCASAPSSPTATQAAQPTQASQGSGQPAQSSGQPVTITLSFIAQGSDQLAPLVADFEKANPNIKVNVQYLPQATLGQATVTALQAGNAADVLYTNGGTGQLHSVFALGKAGYLTDLSQRPWAKDVPAAAHDLYFDGAKLYGAPMGLSLVGVVYNTASNCQELWIRPRQGHGVTYQVAGFSPTLGNPRSCPPPTSISYAPGRTTVMIR